MFSRYVIKNVPSLQLICVVVLFILFWVIINVNLSLSTLHVEQLYINISDEMDLLSCPPQDAVVLLITQTTR